MTTSPTSGKVDQEEAHIGTAKGSQDGQDKPVKSSDSTPLPESRLTVGTRRSNRLAGTYTRLYSLPLTRKEAVHEQVSQHHSQQPRLSVREHPRQDPQQPQLPVREHPRQGAIVEDHPSLLDFDLPYSKEHSGARVNIAPPVQVRDPPQLQQEVPANFLKVPRYSSTNRSSRFTDHVSDEEWRGATRTSEHLTSQWRDEGNAPFNDSDSSEPISTILRKWEMFCLAKWCSPHDVSSVRAFMGGVIEPKIREEIKRAYGRDSLSAQNLRSRYFYEEFYGFSLSYLSEHYTDSVYVTSILQKVLNLRQENEILSKHLEKAEELLDELKFCSSSRAVQLDIDHMSNSIMMSLGDPFRGWFYDALVSAHQLGAPVTFETVLDICRALRKRSRTVGPQRPYVPQPPPNISSMTSSSSSTTTSTTTTKPTGSSTNDGGNNVNFKTVIDSEAGPNGDPNQASEGRAHTFKPHNFKNRGCRRCYKGGHRAILCSAPAPRNVTSRCHCGAASHSAAECRTPASALSCERCGNHPSLPDQHPHRSGVCPYDLTQIQQLEKPKATPPANNLVRIDGEIGCDIPKLEIFSISLPDSTESRSPTKTPPTSPNREVSLAVAELSSGTTNTPTQPCTSIKVGLPDSPSSASVCALALWDTGASGTFIRIDVLKKLAEKANLRLHSSSSGEGVASATLADNQTQIKLLGVCSLTLTSPKTSATVKAYVTDRLSYPVVIGVPSLFALQARLSFSSDGIVEILTGTSDTPNVSTTPTTEVFNTLAATGGHSGTVVIEDKSLMLLLPPAVEDTGYAPGGFFRLALQSVHHLDQPSTTYPSLLDTDAASTTTTSPTTPSDTLLVDYTRGGRLVIDFKPNDVENYECHGWHATVSRAQRSLKGRTAEEFRQIDTAIEKLLASGFVGYMPLRCTAKPPPRSVLARLYSRNPLVRDTYLACDDYLQRHYPLFVPSQFVFKASLTTPCRVVYDARYSNRLLTPPTRTRWDLQSFLVTACTRPVAHCMDIASAFNQVLWTPRSSALCATLIQKPTASTSSSGVPILLLWASMAFGLNASPAGLELATGEVATEARSLTSTLAISPNDFPDPCPSLPPHYCIGHDYSLPVLQAAFTRPTHADNKFVNLLREPCWKDYVDDWLLAGYHVRQVEYNKNLMEAAANFRGFTFPEAKQFSTWRIPDDANKTLLGYKVTTSDGLQLIFDVQKAEHDNVTKKALSKRLSALYDPLGRYLEYSMQARLIWRRIVQSISSPNAKESWNQLVRRELVQEVNDWIDVVSNLNAVPRFIPLDSGPLVDGSSQIIVSCDASGIGWAIDVRARLRLPDKQCPISPRLKGRGGLFPITKSNSISQIVSGSTTAPEVGTTPRKELHALQQASAEVKRLCDLARLRYSTSSVIICTDSLINLQRLRWLGRMTYDEALIKAKHGKKRQLSEFDLKRLLAIRDDLLRLPIPAVVVHVPSALNLADGASRCHTSPVVDMESLSLLLDNLQLRPCYEVPSLSEQLVSEDGCIEDNEDLALCHLSPRAGQMPVPLPEDDTLPQLTESDLASLDALICESLATDTFFNAIYLYLNGQKIDGSLPIEKIKRSANLYLIIDGKLYRGVLQRPDGEIIHQRVIGRGAHHLQRKIILTIHIEHSHLGSRALVRKVRSLYYWPGLEKDVKNALKLCRPCIRTKSLRTFNTSAGAKNVSSLLPGQVQGMDLYLPQVQMPNAGGHASKEVSGCLVLTDLVSGFLSTYLLHGSVTASSVITALNCVFSNTITPTIIMHDNAKAFLSKGVSTWLTNRGVQQLATPVYCPELSLWERSHRELTRAVKSTVNDHTNKKQWWEVVVDAANSLNDIPLDDQLWVSPRMLLFPHYTPQAFLDKDNPSVGNLATRLVPVTDSRSAQRLRETALESHRVSVLGYLRYWESQREKSRARVLEGHRHGRNCDLPVGTEVYHYVTTNAKLQARMKGPFRVAAPVDGATVLLQGFNGDCFKAWVTNVVPIPPWPSTTAQDDSANHFEDEASAKPTMTTTMAESGVATEANSTLPVHTAPPVPSNQYLNRLPFEWNLGDLPPLVVLPPPGR
ncbi:hypothetical protein FOL47_002280 [Perkinsus chesapeaki]|uniref:Integrase catalytic domain-containing protein n=1 Tax=Perkinsus chesapeaki TaxID=330153 RepID=A0A7J6MEP4_PERCH|nr:hypothetical protein FOL47_002280 [Perkinsus chesapeaki]